MDLQLGARRVLITGGSKGIGFAIADAFLREGCDVFLVSRSSDSLAGAAETLRSRHGHSIDVLATDMGREDAAERVFAWQPDIDILINNAGDIPAGTIDKVGPREWRAGWNVKVFGYIDLSRLYLKQMASTPGGGVIVNVIGVAGEMLDAGYIAGSVGNAALIAFTKALGSTSLDHNVRVVGVNPGAVDTERLQKLLKARAVLRHGSDEDWKGMTAQYPAGRAATVAEIADMVAFLASPLSSYTSGTVINIDGGVSQRRSLA